MNGHHNPYKQSLENKQINAIKRSWQSTDGNSYKPIHKKCKQYEIDNSYKSSVDIVTLFKSELERILNNMIPNTTVDDIQPYGSRISGIYTDDSDIDIHIRYTSKLPVKQLIRLFANRIRNSRVFIKVIPIVHAKIPIIKCVHTNSGINCDISFNNITAVHNTHLLKHIISLDDRIKPVLLKLKIWAKNKGLICTNGFSSYSFYWLGLFYLQVLGIVPAICDVQKSVPEHIVGYWNCAFSKSQPTFSKDQQKNLSTNEILNMIYEYYSSFDFKRCVVSPYIGRPLYKKDFENVEQLPEELLRYKQFSKKNKEHHKELFLGANTFNMYTQDPFQHNFNITARVTQKIFDIFIKACVKQIKKPDL